MYAAECSLGTFIDKDLCSSYFFLLMFPHSIYLHLDSRGLKEVGNVCLMGNIIFLMVLRALKTTSANNNHMSASRKLFA